MISDYWKINKTMGIVAAAMMLSILAGFVIIAFIISIMSGVEICMNAIIQGMSRDYWLAAIAFGVIFPAAGCLENSVAGSAATDEGEAATFLTVIG